MGSIRHSDVMASKLAEKVPGWFTRILQPDIQEMKGELKTINARIDSVNVRIDEMDKRLTGKIDEMDKRVTSKIEDMDKRVTSEIRGVKDSLDVAQRLAVLEAKVREQEKGRT